MQDALRNVLEQSDQNGDGFISPHELHQALLLGGCAAGGDAKATDGGEMYKKLIRGAENNATQNIPIEKINIENKATQNIPKDKDKTLELHFCVTTTTF